MIDRLVRAFNAIPEGAMLAVMLVVMVAFMTAPLWVTPIR